MEAIAKSISRSAAKESSSVNVLKDKRSAANNPQEDGASVDASPKEKKFEYIPLLHLNIIFELIQFHHVLSVKPFKEMQSIAGKKNLLGPSPLYQDYCTGSESHTYDIWIEGELYTLEWCNFKERSQSNSFYLSLPESDFPNQKYYYLRFRHQYASGTILPNESRMIWDWYDSDNAKHRKYSPGPSNEVYQELEASFQANVNANFPHDRFGTTNKKDDTIDRPFAVCILPQLKLFLETDKDLETQQLVLRFKFAEKTNRITNIEQVSLRTSGSFPCHVRRLLDMRNSLDFYWQNTNKFIEEWKHRYLLSTTQQQLYFWSYILCIATIMKYIEI
eukprot:179833_1